jgi:SM-20-related protein
MPAKFEPSPHDDPPAAAMLRINPELDVAALARAYADEGRVRVYGLLSEGAVALHRQLESRGDWIHLISSDGGAIELDSAAKAALSPEAWAQIEAAALARAQAGFQYRYYGLRVPDDEEASAADDLLAAFRELMRSEAMLDLLRAITGEGETSFTDGHATAYGPGDFLTGHDDDVAGKDRLAAYVYGLTPLWRLEWGGLLLFHGENDRTAHALVPRFNTLDLFKVPQQHSVSQVTGSATHRRHAVTGWLRRHT